jgi:hypothetical protein
LIASWLTHDPATGLFISCTMSGAEKDPENEAHLFRCEFSEDEPSTYHSLIGVGTDYAILSRATAGQVDRASRFREIFSPYGFTDELRVVLRIDGTAWGSATLLRTGGRFEPRHAESVRAIARQAADGIRLALLRAAAARPEVVDEPPGIVLARPNGGVTPLTGPAEHWLAVGGHDLVTAINVAAAAIRQHPTSQSATTRVVLPDGRVLALRAAGTTSRSQRVTGRRLRPDPPSTRRARTYPPRQPDDPARPRARNLRAHRPGPPEGDLRTDVRLEPIRALGAPPIRAVRPASLERRAAEPLRRLPRDSVRSGRALTGRAAAVPALETDAPARLRAAQAAARRVAQRDADTRPEAARAGPPTISS